MSAHLSVHQRMVCVGKANGFSLVELMVVIAILALLISLVMPGLNSAQTFARSAKCKSNLKQQGVALYLFAQDHNGASPSYNLYPFYNGLGRYLGMASDTGSIPRPLEVYQCPAVRDPGGNNFDPLGVVQNSPYRHYAMGMWFTYYSGVQTPRRIDLSQFSHLSYLTGNAVDQRYARTWLSGGPYIVIKNHIFQEVGPSEVVAIADSRMFWFKHTPSRRHDDRANGVFLDGSVKSFRTLASSGDGALPSILVKEW